MIGRRSRGGLVACLAVSCSLVVASCSLGDSTSESEADRTIVIFGPYRGVEADRFVSTFQDFVDDTGITVRYTGSNDFVTDLVSRVDNSAQTPDIAVIPQPGLVEQLVTAGSAFPIASETSQQLEDSFDADVADTVRFDGTDNGVPFRRTLKSVVWYRPDVFEAEGWKVPQTLDELETLSERIVESEREIAPWCFSMSAGDSTGWAATDWVEDIVVRRAGEDVYRQWADGEIGFGDPRIEAAFEEFHRLVLGTDRVAGGLTAVVSTPVQETWRPLLDAEPGCAMYRQADFALDWMPDVEVGPNGDIDWFVLPGAEGPEAPLLIGGDTIVALDDRTDVADLLDFYAGTTAGLPWVEQGGFLSAESTIAPGAYPEVERGFIETLDEAEVQVFDASDQMPPAIGSSLLWEQISAWVTGAIDYGELADTVDTARRALDDV